VTLKKTIIGAAIVIAAFFALGTRADAQDPTPTPEPTTEAEATPTPEATTDAETTPTPEATTEAETTPTPEATTEAEATPTPAATAEAQATTTPEATAEPTAAPTDAGSGGQTGGSEQLAFTGPDTRVMALGALLLGAGALFLFGAHLRRERVLTAEAWVE